MNKSWRFWSRVAKFVKRKQQQAWLKGPSGRGNCDSACSRCKVWESEGNRIYTIPLVDGSEKRQCTNCGYEWRALFTPAGFVKIGEWEGNEGSGTV